MLKARTNFMDPFLPFSALTRKRSRSFQTLPFLFILLFPLSIIAQEYEGGDVIPGRIMAQLEKGADPKEVARDLKSLGGNELGTRSEQQLSEYMNVWLYSYDPDAMERDRVLAAFQGHEDITIAQFEHRLERRAVPNDPNYTSPNNWHYDNDGSGGGVPDADIDAPAAWDITTGGTTVTGDSIVVAVIDGGFDIDHEDLNFFKNQDELNGTPGVDDDGNGYVDDVNGWDVHNNDGTIDSDDHGTHVAGTVGAIGDNGTGYVGVNWDVQVLPIQGSSTNESTVVSAYDYAVKMRDMYDSTNGQKGAYVVATNSSFGVNFGDPANFPLWCAMYDTLGAYGITSAVAGPNLDIDIDSQGDVPGTCPSEHMICLTNTEIDDSKNSSGYGDTHVDLGAPGTGILSTTGSDSYGQKTGTSMSSPHVAGAIGLLYSVDCPDLMSLAQNQPDSASRLMKKAIVEGVDTIGSMSGVTVSNGRLNIHKALLELGDLGYCDSVPCYDPNSLIVDGLTDSSALLHYAAPDSADSVEVAYRELPGGAWVSEFSSPVGSFPIDDGLQGCTSYEFRVRAYCGPDTSDWGGPLTFETLGCCEASGGPYPNALQTNSINLGWDSIYAASSYELDHRSLDSSVWKGAGGVQSTDTSFDSLETCQGYEFRVRADCDTGYSPYTPVDTFYTRCSPCDSISYCPSEGQDVSYEWIDSVAIAEVNNKSGENGGYLFAGGPNSEFWEDSSYVVTLAPGFADQTFLEYFRIWIDLDRDGSFDVPEERVYESSGGSSTVTDTLHIPDSISGGGSRMRISMQFDSLPSVCADVPFGEVEDYCVRLREREKSDGEDTSSLVRYGEKGSGSKLYPNPAEDRVRLVLDRVPGPGTYFVLHDVLGQEVLRERIEKRRTWIDLQGLKSGAYFFRILGDDFHHNGKLIVEGH